jgi:hypothetical protein
MHVGIAVRVEHYVVVRERFVRFGSEADICSALGDIRFTLRKDIRGAATHVCLVALLLLANAAFH